MHPMAVQIKRMSLHNFASIYFWIVGLTSRSVVLSPVRDWKPAPRQAGSKPTMNLFCDGRLLPNQDRQRKTGMRDVGDSAPGWEVCEFTLNSLLGIRRRSEMATADKRFRQSGNQKYSQSLAHPRQPIGFVPPHDEL